MQNPTFFSKLTVLLLAVSILISSCASSTLIQSTPEGAKLYINGQPVGTTPHTYRDSKITGSTTTIRIEKQGYETMNTSFSRDEVVDVGAIVGGFFLLFPFLWTMKYEPTHYYELVPITKSEKSTVKTIPTQEGASKAERLKEFKQLLDDNAITQEEYDKEKQKILAEDE